MKSLCLVFANADKATQEIQMDYAYEGCALKIAM